MFAEMLRRLESDPLWAREYEEFVRQVSFAGAGEAIDFAAALPAWGRLVASVIKVNRMRKSLVGTQYLR
jgi:hypothetical protein